MRENLLGCLDGKSQLMARYMMIVRNDGTGFLRMMQATMELRKPIARTIRINQRIYVTCGS